MDIRDHIKNMTSYEKAKLVVDFLRFIATAAAPLMIILLGHFAKVYLGW